jgi:hypothetical protein
MTRWVIRYQGFRRQRCADVRFAAKYVYELLRLDWSLRAISRHQPCALELNAVSVL